MSFGITYDVTICSLDVKPTSKSRPNTNAPKQNKTEEYDDNLAMKKIQANVVKQQEWQNQIDKEQQEASEDNGNPAVQLA